MSKRHSFIKKSLHVILWMIFALLIFLISIAVLIQVPAIQTKIVHSAASFVRNKTHTKVDIRKFRISFPKSVVIEGLFLEDLKKDTLLYAGELKINIALFDLLYNKINILSFSLENVNLNLNRSTSDSLFNYNFLIKAFSDTTKRQKADNKTKPAWTFSVGQVNMNDIRFRYDDAYGGMNLSTTLKNLKLHVDGIDLEKSIFLVDELLVESLDAQVQIMESSQPAKSKSTGILPLISANYVQIVNSTLDYGHSTNNQTIKADINQFELKKGAVDLQKQLVSLDQLSLLKSELQFNTSDKESSPDTIAPLPDVSEKGDWKISAKSINLDNNSLAFHKGDKTATTNAFDADHLDYQHITLVATDVAYSSDTILASIKKFSATDEDQFSITQFETDFSMDQHSITADKLILKTNNTSIDADLAIQYPSLNSLKDSFPFMVLNVNLKNVRFKNSDILYFSPQLIELPFFNDHEITSTISGIVTGAVNDLSGKNLVISTGSHTLLHTDFSITGLPDLQTAHYDFPNLNIISGRKDIEMIAGSSIPDNMELPENIELQIDFNGRLKEFESTISMGSSFGAANIFATIDPNENFNGKVNILDFNIGRLLNDTALFGPVSLNLETTGQGLNPDSIQAIIVGEVSQMVLNSYNYQHLKINGNINGRQYGGKINLNDENAVFDLDGLVNLKPNEEEVKFLLNVQGVDLQKLHLTTDDMQIGLVASANLKKDSANKMVGKAAVNNLILMYEGERYGVDSLFVASINKTNDSKLTSSSAVIGLQFAGTVSPSGLPSELNRFINQYFQFSDSIPQLSDSELSQFNFEIQIRNHPILSKILLPLPTDFDPIFIRGNFNNPKEELNLNATMNHLMYGNIEVNDLVLDVNSDSNSLNYKISSSNISNPQIKVDHFLFDGKLSENTMWANVSSTDDKQHKKLLIRSQLNRDATHYKLTLDPTNFYLMNDRWDIASDHYIKFGSQGILIHNLTFKKAESEIRLSSVHEKFDDDLNIAIQHFKLHDLFGIIEKDSNLVNGTVDGNILLKKVHNSYGIVADAQITDLVVQNVSVGNLSLKAENPTTERFELDVRLLGMENDLRANGYIIPGGGDNSIHIKGVFKSLSMKTIEAFSMGQIKEASGTVSGNFLIKGATNSPEITGELVFNNAFIKPALLNNRLELKHETVQLKTDGVYFNSFTMADTNQNTATINGSVKMKQFGNFVFDLHVKTKDFLLFNTTSKDNKVFFGKMIIDSKIDITGPMSLPVVNADLKMKKGSNFTFAVPQNKLSTNKGEGVVTFNNPSDHNEILYRDEQKQIQKSSFKGFDLSSTIEIDKQATLRLLMDPTSTDSLVVRGEAALNFTMDRSGKISLTGAYHLNDGSYIVSLESIVKRKFAIEDGSTIIWNGDPLDAEISIDAVYSVRTSPINLVADQITGLSESEKNTYKQRYLFLVLLKLRGDILHPEISFEIQLPPEDKGILGGAVNAKLNLLNEDPSALNKQVFALLVLGRFVQENPLQTGTSDGTSALVRATVGKFLSAELNKLSSKVVPGVELNFDVRSYDDYESSQAVGRTQVDIGLKKQLFNERLSVQIGGVVDVEGAKAKQNSLSDVTSDVTVEYKLTRDGRYRLVGFSHNRYAGAIEGQLVETGVGIIYVRDFDQWKEFFKTLKQQK
ncbi:MAG: translocation/assembly module TamB [Bacteroidetes bacterium]|nr:translocation/assembly module TamB [Bacteroidota bacterium]